MKITQKNFKKKLFEAVKESVEHAKKPKLKDGQVWYCNHHNHLILVKYVTKEVVYLFTDLLDGTYHDIDTLIPYYRTDFEEIEMQYIGDL